MGCHFLFKEIFPIYGSNPHLLDWQADSLPLSTWEVQVIHGHNQIGMLELGICWYWSAWISALELNMEFSPLLRNCGTSFYPQCMSSPLGEPQVDPLSCGSSHMWTQPPGVLSVSYWRPSTICEQGACRVHSVSPEPSPVHKHNMLSESFIEGMNSSNACGMFFTDL